MYKPSPILTMISYNGETHVDQFIRESDEHRARLMAFITSPEVRETMKILCRDVLSEELKILGGQRSDRGTSEVRS